MIIPCLISYVTGTLLTAAFIVLLSHAIQNLSAMVILSTVIVGIIIFFTLEKLVIWRHYHDVECEIHDTAGPIILFGDAFHNLTDGVIIAASFMVSIPIGVITSFSVIAHENPQKVGDFLILLHSGYSKRKSLLFNTLSSLSTFPGAIIAYYTLEVIQSAIPYIIAISAASFLYIALADLIPELHRKTGFLHTIRQFILLFAGIGTILFLHFYK